MKKTNKTIFVYHDGDHGDIELFKTLEAAKAHAEKCWPDCFEEDEEEGDQRGWTSDRNKYFLGEYVTIFERIIRN